MAFTPVFLQSTSRICRTAALRDILLRTSLSEGMTADVVNLTMMK
jgi:hypothetical protein